MAGISFTQANVVPDRFLKDVDRILRTLCIAWLCIATGLPASRGEGGVSRFAFGGLPATITNGMAFTVAVEARDIYGNRRTDVSGAFPLTAYSRPWAGLIFTELADNCRRIELMNAGAEPVDVSGYAVTFFSGSVRNPEITFPSDRHVAPGQVIVLLGNELGTNEWPSVPSGSWGTIVLRNSAGRALDEISISGSAYWEFWTGEALRSFSDGLNLPDFERFGSEPRYSAAEWRRGPSTIGRANPGLTIPRGGLRATAGIAPKLIVFTNGLWSGDISVSVPTGLAILAVDNGEGRLSESATIRVVPLPRLAMEVASIAAAASEATAGEFATLRITRPQPPGAEAVIRLRSDYPGEIAVPEFVKMPAGQASVTFAVTNLDDSIPDGRALVTITASAPGFTDSTISLTNDDDEVVALAIDFENSVQEGSGRNHRAGLIYVPEPAIHPVEVRLSAAGMLTIPPRVIIPPGEQSVRFPVFVTEDDEYVNPLPRWATVTASIGVRGIASTKIGIGDNEDRQWWVSYPAAIREGVPAEFTFSLACAADAPRRVGVVPAMPWIAPVETLIPAGITNFSVFVLYPTNGIRNHENRSDIKTWVDVPPNPEAYSNSRQVDIIDRETIPGSVAWQMPPAFSAGQPFPIRIEVLDGRQPAATNVAGRIRIRAPGNTVRFVGGDTMPVFFTNGVFNGFLSMEGSGIDVELEVEVAGLTRSFGPLDVLDSWSSDGSYLDFAVIPETSRIVASAGPLTNATGLLVEIDVETKGVAGVLVLPRPVSKISVTPDGRSAWCGDVDGNLHRIDLGTWRREETLSVRDDLSTTFSLESLLAAGGVSDRVLAAILLENNSPLASERKLVAVEKGGLLSASALAGVPITSGIRDLVAGRTPDEFYIVDRGGTPPRLTRALFEPGRVDYGAGVHVPRLAVSGVVLAEGRLWVGTSIRNPETLDFVQPDRYPADSSSILSFGRKALTATIRGDFLTILDVTDARWLGSHHLDYGSSVPGRLQKALVVDDIWIVRLIGGSSGGSLIFNRSPLVDHGGPTADIAIRPLDETGSSAPGFKTIEVRNLGPAFAADCRLEVRTDSTTNLIRLGGLLPGLALTNLIEVRRIRSGIAETSVSAAAAPRDPEPDNNRILVLTTNYPPADPGVRQLHVSIRHMVVSPDQNTIYAAVRSLPGTEIAGVVEIDPAAGTITRSLPVEDPHRLEVMGTNALLIQSGYGRLLRWHLASGAMTPEVTMTNAGITGFTAIADGTDRLAVTTTDGIYLFRNGVGVSRRSLFHATNKRVLTVVGDRIWSISSSGFDAIPFSQDGLGQGFGGPLELPAHPRTLTAAGNRLHIDTERGGAILDMGNRLVRSANLPSPMVTDTRLGCVFGWSNGIVRLDEAALTRTAYELRRHPGNNWNLMMVRWGDRGFAIGGEDESLHLFESPIVESRQDDLELVGRIETPLGYGERIIWNLTVTNRGDAVVEHAYLSVKYRPWEISGISLGEPLQTYTTRFDSYLLDSPDIGPIPAGGARTLRVTGSMLGNLQLSARVTSMRTDRSPDDNSARIDFFSAPSDLALKISGGPRHASAGDLLEYRLVVTNLSPSRFRGRIGISLEYDTPLTLVSSGLDTEHEAGHTIRISGIRSIENAGSAVIPMVLRADVPGIYNIRFFLTADTDYWQENNAATAAVGIDSPSSNGPVVPVSVAGRQVEWIPALQTLAIGEPAMIRMARPFSFETMEIPISGGLAGFKVCADGRHAWVLTGSSELVRVDLESGETEPAVASPPAIRPGNFETDSRDAGILYVLRRSDTDRYEAVVFSSGIELANHVPFSLREDRAIRLVAGAPGKCYIVNEPHLFELELDRDGLRLKREWSDPDIYGEIAGADHGRIVFSYGKVFYMASGRMIQNPRILGFDRETDAVFSFRRENNRWGSMAKLGMLSAASEMEWEIPLHDANASDVPRIIPMGTNGVLLLGNRSWIVKPDAWDHVRVDWSMRAVAAPVLPRVGFSNLISISVTNRGDRFPRNPRVEVELTDGIESTGNPGLRSFSIPLPQELGVTSVPFPVRFTKAGEQRVLLSIHNDMPVMATAAEISSSLSFDVEEAPSLWLMEGAATRDGSFIFGLSRKADETIAVPYRIDWVSVSRQITNSQSGTVWFYQGRAFADLRASAPEGLHYESRLTATITFSGDGFANSPATFHLEMAPRERPGWLNVQGTTIDEGDEGVSEALVPVILYPASTVPVEVDYEVSSLIANTTLSSGRLRFSPGQTTNFVSFPVAGNRVFQRTPPVVIRLFQPWNAYFSSPGLWHVGIREDDPVPQPRVELNAGRDGLLRLGFMPDVNVIYKIQYNTNISANHWTTLADHLCPTTFFECPIETDDDARFYRVIGE